MAPDQAFDEWKSQRKIRRYHPEVGVKHTWRSMKSTFSVRHVLDKEG